MNTSLKENIDRRFTEIIKKNNNKKNKSITKANPYRLINLNGRHIKYSRPLKGYINLTIKILSADLEELLNRGLNCHIMSKPKRFQKRTECEVLIDDVEKLKKKCEVTGELSFKLEVIAEGNKSRCNHKSRLIENEHIEAVKQLQTDPNITIRKVDKVATYVLINTSEYLDKIDTILSDKTKFKKIIKDPN